MSIEKLKKVLANECLDFVCAQVNGSDEYQDIIARIGTVLLAFGARFPEEFNELEMEQVGNIMLEKLADNGLLTEDDVNSLRYETDSPELATSGDEKEVV